MKKTIFLVVLAIVISITAITLWKTRPTTITTKTVDFSVLQGFDETNLSTSFEAFKKSCQLFLRKSPDTKVGSAFLHMKARDWQPACQQAMTLKNPTNERIHQYFKQAFKPIAFSSTGLFTGYYLPVTHGSIEKTAEFTIPIYAIPADLVSVNLNQFKPAINRHLTGRIEQGKLLPYHSRAAIHKGAIKGKAQVLVYLHSPIDRLFIEIQGSGVIKLKDGKTLFISYAAENGLSYTPIGKVLVEKGVFTPQTASMQAIRAYLETHPDEAIDIINKNQSFVFFRALPIRSFEGAQGVPLTSGYSLAIDRKYLPMGAPVWLITSHPVENSTTPAPLHRLMIAQDTGGAIRGPIRGDVFWGPGKEASYIAGHMKNQGQYWMLIPKHVEVPGVIDN